MFKIRIITGNRARSQSRLSQHVLIYCIFINIIRCGNGSVCKIIHGNIILWG